MIPNGDFFALFDLRRAYEIDRAQLEAAYERLSLAHHPDFFSTAGAEEKQASERMSAAINEGYRVLGSDAARAAYLLGLLAAGRDLDTQSLPPGFLQRIFSLQEEVDELDDDDSPERRQALKAEAAAKLADILAERGRLFGQAGDGSDASLLQAIQSNLNCERYLQRLMERLD